MVTKLILYLLLTFVIILASGCICSRVELTQERMVAVPEESYEIEYYTVTVPVMVDEPKKIPRKVQKFQEIELDACGDLVVISNPSDEPLTISLKRD